MNDSLTLTAKTDVWLPTYTPDGEADGAIQLALGQTYTLDFRTIKNSLGVASGYLNVSNYCMDELLVKTADVWAVVDCFEITLHEDAAHD